MIKWQATRCFKDHLHRYKGTNSKIHPHRDTPACYSQWQDRRVGGWNQVPALLGPPPVGKGNVIPVQTMKAYRGSRGTEPLINLGTR